MVLWEVLADRISILVLIFFFTADKELGGAPDLEEIVCFLVRDFNGLPPYNGVQWSTTDISYVVFQIEFAKMSESPSPINVKPHAQ